jgi:O-antigen ligase
MTQTMTRTSTAGLERWGFIALAGALGLIQLNIRAEALFGIAALLWLIIALRERQRPDVPGFFLPLLVLAVWTLVSTAFSPDIVKSLREDKQMVLYLIVPVTMRLARGARASTIANVIVAVGAATALIGVVQFAALGYDSLNERPRGLLDHYMTYSGLLMLVVCVATAGMVFRGTEWIWPGVAVPALLVALVVSRSRNAWAGAALAIATILSLKNWRWVLVVPVTVAIALAVAPESIRQRALSSFDPNDPTRRDRFAMLESGKRMIADHPLLGVGPNIVPDAYLATYKTPDAVDPPDKRGSTRSHLHNVPVQLAAERGLPALAAWLWFVVVAIRDLYRQFRRGTAVTLSVTGLAAMVAMLIAGLFEHNFGDSEFLLLFLGIITLPFAAASRLQRAPAATT